LLDDVDWRLARDIVGHEVQTKKIAEANPQFVA
jgi:hypothetical protein